MFDLNLNIKANNILNKLTTAYNVSFWIFEESLGLDYWAIIYSPIEDKEKVEKFIKENISPLIDVRWKNINNHKDYK